MNIDTLWSLTPCNMLGAHLFTYMASHPKVNLIRILNHIKILDTINNNIMPNARYFLALNENVKYLQKLSVKVLYYTNISSRCGLHLIH